MNGPDLLTYLNLGCGANYHPSWLNVDLVPSSRSVYVCDLRKGIPFPAESFAVVYHSHLLEHFPRQDAGRLIGECFRVLRPGGILRVVVPDLEAIARNYLLAIERAQEGNANAEVDYDWMMLELYDQVVRTSSGGEMGRALARPEIRKNEFVRSRVGAELTQDESPRVSLPKLAWGVRLRRAFSSAEVRRWRVALSLRAVALIGGSDAYAAFSEGLFRRSGELHFWMYDRFSLRRLLGSAGFTEIQFCRADESRIPEFSSYQLDVTNGRIRKPDSLYMEASKER